MENEGRSQGGGLVVKFLILGCIMIGMQYPLSSISGLLWERSARRETAGQEVSQMAGGAQRLQGPFLLATITETTPPKAEFEIAVSAGAIPETTTSAHSSQVGESTPPATVTGTGAIAGINSSKEATLAAEKVPGGESKDNKAIPPVRPRVATQEVAIAVANAQIQTELSETPLRRGLYNFSSFATKVKISGEVLVPVVSRSATPGSGERSISMSSTALAFKISDPRFLDSVTDIRWGGLEPANIESRQPGLIAIELPEKNLVPGDRIPFALVLTLRGSSALTFVPGAASWDLILKASGHGVSFIGDLLPAEREIGKDFATGTWRLGKFAAAESCSPYCPLSQLLSRQNTEVGVRLTNELEPHTMVARAIKYQTFFLVLTFCIYVLFEVVAKIRLHPVQYLLVAIALTLFYLLLLALAEHIGFSLAYLLAATSLAAMVSGYSCAILRSRKQGITVGSLLLTLYAYFYTVLLEQEFALLYGSIGLTTALAAIMYLTRKINWYEFGVSAEPIGGIEVESEEIRE